MLTFTNWRGSRLLPGSAEHFCEVKVSPGCQDGVIRQWMVIQSDLPVSFLDYVGG